MTAPETRQKRVIVRWTARKSFVAIALFFLLSLIFEVLLVYSFQVLGLVDHNVWASTVTVPNTNWTLTVSVSPMFHLLPLGVIAVLLTSWAYLTNSTAFVSQRTESARRASQSPRRAQEDHRFKSLRRFTKRISQRLQRLNRALMSAVGRIRGVSYISQRLQFARTAVRSAVNVLIIFLLVAIIMIFAGYPRLIYTSVLNMYRNNPSLLNLVLGVGNWINGVGAAIPQLGGLGSALNSGLINVAPGFRRALQGAGASLTSSIVGLDASGKYVLSQNLSAWIAALIALLYGSLASSQPQRRHRGR